MQIRLAVLLMICYNRLMKISRETLEIFYKQLRLDCNMEESEEIKKGRVYLSPSKVLPGGRVCEDTDMFFRAILFMGKAYLMADPIIYAGCREVFKDVEPEWFCKFPNLRILDHILMEYGREIADTHIYFLPDADAPKIDETNPVRWFDRDEIAGLKESNPFHNALAYSRTQPDVIAVAAMNGEKMKGMAGASLDGTYVRQIGIDVLPEFRGEGLATYLTTLLKQKIRKDELLPFYGTSESHGISRSVAIHSGFLPAWTEIYVKKSKV